jgi:hypothetical protein
MLGIVAFENVAYFMGSPWERLVLGLAEARLRPLGYGEAAFATRGLAEPKQA